MPRKAKPIMPGRLHGRLRPQQIVSYDKHGREMWECLCLCGTTTTVNALHLRTGHTRSCGCLRRDFPNGQTHGRSRTKIYRIWSAMKSRCDNPSATSYQWYGAQGIGYDPAWASFEQFLADMGEAPDGMTLDRIDSTAGYSKANCRWADALTQSNNAKSNRLLTFDGKTQTVAAWSREIGVPAQTLYTRLDGGWSVEDTLTIPPRGRRTTYA